MRKGLFILLLAAAIAFAGYWIYYRCATAPVRTMATQSDGGVEWLRHEYHLSDAQFARIQQIHRDYAPKCDRMCEQIGKANARLEQTILASKAYTPEVAAAMKECLAVQGECRQALLTHVYAVSAEMPPADGARYLEMMKARIVEPAIGQQALISESAR